MAMGGRCGNTPAVAAGEGLAGAVALQGEQPVKELKEGGWGLWECWSGKPTD